MVDGRIHDIVTGVGGGQILLDDPCGNPVESSSNKPAQLDDRPADLRRDVQKDRLVAEPAGPTHRAIASHAGLILTGEDMGSQFSAAADARLVEDRLQVLLDSGTADSKRRTNLFRRRSLKDQPGDFAFALGEVVGLHDHRSHLYRCCRCDNDGDLALDPNP